jgi:hypothetical protein
MHSLPGLAASRASSRRRLALPLKGGVSVGLATQFTSLQLLSLDPQLGATLNGNAYRIPQPGPVVSANGQPVDFYNVAAPKCANISGGAV